MARFIRLLVIGYWLLVGLHSSTRADEASTLLAAPYQPPYQWFASTDPKNQNADYKLLRPGETRRVPLAPGVLLRLWSTASEPEKIELSLQRNDFAGARFELLKNGRARVGNYYQKAYTFYPDASTPAAARVLSKGAALVVTNRSKQPNKWFYQVAVRPAGALAPASKLTTDTTSRVEDKVSWEELDGELKQAALAGRKLFEQTKNQQTDFRLCLASGSARSQKGRPIPILKIKGEGAFVGLALDIRPAPDATRRTFAFLEGNETLIADGRTYEGTGTEDFFNSAWYFPDKPFSQKYHGLTLKSTLPPRVTAYRWMVADAVPFKQNFEFQLEHGNGNNSDDLEYRWAAFWYQKPPLDVEIQDALKDAREQGSTSTASAESGVAVSPLLIWVALGGAAGVLILLFALRQRGAKN